MSYKKNFSQKGIIVKVDLFKKIINFCFNQVKIVNASNAVDTEDQITNVFDKNDSNCELDPVINPFHMPSQTLYSKIMWIIILPIHTLFYFTVPDCRRKVFSRFPFYFLTFFMSTIYLGILTYLIVWMVVIIGKLFKIKLKKKFLYWQCVYLLKLIPYKYPIQ